MFTVNLVNNIRVKLLRDGAKIPTRAHTTDAGADLYAWNDFVIEPLPIPNSVKGMASALMIDEYQPLKYPSGIAIELPQGYFAQIESKSSLAAKGITTIGNIVDENYRGELHVVFINLSYKSLYIKQGQKIAQLVVKPYLQCNYIQTFEELSETDRGTGGFGSTNIY